jgi:putative ABC transport system ATP-binding protein
MDVARVAQPVLLRLRDVHHAFRSGNSQVRALAGVNLDVRAGEAVAITGPSGSGKSTLLHVIAGIEPLQEGEVLLEGQSLRGLSDAELHRLRRRRLGLVFQSFNLLANLRAGENVALPLELDGVRRDEAQRRAQARLASVGLGEQLARFPDELSGGQQQRVAVARALVAGAKILLADEPTGSLDSATGERVVELLVGRAVAEGAAVLIVTHDDAVAARCHRRHELRDGLLGDEATAA